MVKETLNLQVNKLSLESVDRIVKSLRVEGYTPLRPQSMARRFEVIRRLDVSDATVKYTRSINDMCKV